MLNLLPFVNFQHTSGAKIKIREQTWKLGASEDWEFWHRLQRGRISPLVTPCCFSLFFLLPSSSFFFCPFHISSEIHCSSSKFPALEQCVLKLHSRERQYKWNLCCSFDGALYIVLSDIKKERKKEKKTTIKVSHLVSFECEKALRVKKHKAANGNQLHRNAHPCILLPGSTTRMRPKCDIRSTWNSVPNLQTSYHDCTCKLVR